jgi:hypothetical protein
MTTLCNWRTAELLHRLQKGTHRGKGGAADQSIQRRMGLGTACKEETSRMKNVSIALEEKMTVFQLMKTALTDKFLYIDA